MWCKVLGSIPSTTRKKLCRKRPRMSVCTCMVFSLNLVTLLCYTLIRVLLYHASQPRGTVPICTLLLPELVLSLILTSLVMGLLSGYRFLFLLMYPLAAQRALMRKKCNHILLKVLAELQ